MGFELKTDARGRVMIPSPVGEVDLAQFKKFTEDVESVANESKAESAEALSKADEALTKANDPMSYVPDGAITSSKLKTASESDRIGLVNLKTEVIQAMAGTTPVNSVPADGSVTTTKYANDSIVESKLSQGFNNRPNIDGSAGGDLNNAVKAGAYLLLNSPTNKPAGSSSSGLLEVAIVNSRWIFQKFVTLSDSGKTWTRMLDLSNPSTSKWYPLHYDYKGYFNSGQDLNTFIDRGIYYVNNVTNKPSNLSGSAFVLEVVEVTDYSWAVQKIYSVTDPSIFCTRYVNRSTLTASEWIKSTETICKIPSLSSSNDLNNYTDTGRWVAISAQNSPYTNSWNFEVERYYTYRNSASYWGIQRCTSTNVNDSNFASYMRNFYVNNGVTTFGAWVRVDNRSNGYEAISGKKVVNFGDSIFGNTDGSTSISGYISSVSGATAYNVGFGGCRMSVHSQYWDAFSMYQLAEAIATQDFTMQDNAIIGGTGLPSYFPDHLDLLKSIDFNEVQYITIAYGTNDYTAGKELDNELDPEDVNTFNGALRYSLRRLYEAYPHLKILVLTPTYRFWTDEGTGEFLEDSDTKTYNASGDTLKEFAEATLVVAKEFKTPALDQYFDLGINKVNRLEFYTTSDGTHPQANGREKMARKICAGLISRF